MDARLNRLSSGDIARLEVDHVQDLLAIGLRRDLYGDRSATAAYTLIRLMEDIPVAQEGQRDHVSRAIAHIIAGRGLGGYEMDVRLINACQPISMVARAEVCANISAIISEGTRNVNNDLAMRASRKIIALSPDVGNEQGRVGQYFCRAWRRCMRADPLPQDEKQVVAQRIWDLSARIFVPERGDLVEEATGALCHALRAIVEDRLHEDLFPLADGLRVTKRAIAQQMLGLAEKQPWDPATRGDYHAALDRHLGTPNSSQEQRDLAARLIRQNPLVR